MVVIIRYMVVVCCIAKNEHRYINDFVRYYLHLGVDKIYIYDNDDPNKSYIGDFIDNKDKVEIIDKRGIKGKGIQTLFYNEFYEKYKNTFEWCIVCDVDEYLTGTNNIKEYLYKNKDRYTRYGQIRVRWRLFGDDDLIERDTSEPIWCSFHKEIKHSLHRNLMQKGNLEIQGKCIVKGGMDNVFFKSVHFISGCLECLPSGKEIHSGVAIKESYENEDLYFNHYMTKTLSEFVEQKLGRHDAVYGNYLDLSYFWRINKITIEKREWLRKRGLI